TNPIGRVTGTVRVGQTDIYAQSSPVEIRRRIGMVYQRPNPFPTMSIYDNVASGLRLNGYRNRKVLDEVVERSLQQAALWEEVKNDLKKKSGASLNQPIAALPLQIYVYAISPYDEWHRLARAGALVLILLIVVSVALVRYVTTRGVLKGAS
ncbi:MAG: hypothetical protein WBX22_26545, partial [Silvibacterium sp.]